MAAACATIGIGIIRKRDENQDIVKLKKKIEAEKNFMFFPQNQSHPIFFHALNMEA